MDSIRTRVTGVSHSNDDGSERQDILRDYCSDGGELVLYRDLNNRYDQDAVAVYVENGGRHRQMGYLNREVALQVARHMDAGLAAHAVILQVTGGDADRPSLGCNIEVFCEDYEAVPFEPVTTSPLPISFFAVLFVSAVMVIKGTSGGGSVLTYAGCVLAVLGGVYFLRVR